MAAHGAISSFPPQDSSWFHYVVTNPKMMTSPSSRTLIGHIQADRQYDVTDDTMARLLCTPALVVGTFAFKSRAYF